MIEQERENLRNELQFLKNCQVQYFVLSVAAAGAIAGFGSSFDEQKTIFLSPLLVILPCWWIFFDKGTTISRIVAYLRILEWMILKNQQNTYIYIGWENALSIFRKVQQGADLSTKIKEYFGGLWKGLTVSLPLLTTHKYWALNWYTFFGLGFASLWLSFPGNAWHANKPWTTFLALFIISALHNLSILGRLTKSSSSYESNFEQWKKILCSPGAKAYLEYNSPQE